jgi:hypothetical protein
LLVVEKRAAKVTSLALGASCLQATSRGKRKQIQMYGTSGTVTRLLALFAPWGRTTRRGGSHSSGSSSRRW